MYHRNLYQLGPFIRVSLKLPAFQSLVIGVLIFLAPTSNAVAQARVDSSRLNPIVREGMFVSFGLGGTLINSNVSVESDFPLETGSGWQNFGLATSFRIGHALNTHWVIYYHNLLSLANESTLENRSSSPRNSIFAHSLTGIGATYFKNETAPSAYFNASVGMASRRDIEVVYEYAESGLGIGFSFGLGYQFANRWSIEGNVFYGNVKGKPNYDYHWRSEFWSGQISINYIWFRSFKQERMANMR